MAYCTAGDVKTYLGLTSTADIMLITALAGYAQKWIEQYTGRLFEAESATRNYDVPEDGSRSLVIDTDDLLTVTTLTNGNGTVITGAYYTLYPRNESPKNEVRLKATSGLYWTADSTGETEGVISIAGTWGYSATAPGDIKFACIRLTGFLYRQKDAQVFDTTASPGMGVITIPQGMPKEVKLILDRYKRLV